jgi:hypothetical protein
MKLSTKSVLSSALRLRSAERHLRRISNLRNCLGVPFAVLVFIDKPDFEVSAVLVKA